MIRGVIPFSFIYYYLYLYISMFEIVLIQNKDYITQYTSFMIPLVNDKVSISDNQIFIVQERLISIVNQSKVLLFGVVESL